MNFENKLLEMARELLPQASSKEDKKILSQLKKMYKKDITEFNRKLKRINIVRKSEGLDLLHKNEILGRSLKKDIKTRIEKNPISKPKIIKITGYGLNKGMGVKFWDGKKEYDFTITGDSEKLKKESGTIPENTKFVGHEIRFPNLGYKLVFKSPAGLGPDRFVLRKL